MPAMHDTVFANMSSVLEHKKEIMLRTLEFEMTHEECIRLVAPAEHIYLLTTAAEIAECRAEENWMIFTVPELIDGHSDAKVMLMMRTHAQKTPPLRPRSPRWQPPTPKTIEAGDKVVRWITKRWEIGKRFGAARHVLHTLNQECETGHQLRYMFPAVMHLCRPGMDTRMDRWIDKFGAYRPCRHTPAVSLELKRAIQDAGALLTAVALMGDDVPCPAPGFVSISAFDMPSFRLDGSLVRRL